MLQEMAIECPACGEPFALEIETTSGDEQEYVQDCPVCGRPLDVYIRCRPWKVLSVSVSVA